MTTSRSTGRCAPSRTRCRCSPTPSLRSAMPRGARTCRPTSRATRPWAWMAASTTSPATSPCAAATSSWAPTASSSRRTPAPIPPPATCATRIRACAWWQSAWKATRTPTRTASTTCATSSPSGAAMAAPSGSRCRNRRAACSARPIPPARPASAGGNCAPSASTWTPPKARALRATPPCASARCRCCTCRGCRSRPTSVAAPACSTRASASPAATASTGGSRSISTSRRTTTSPSPRAG